jgi:hypothetical protein
MFLFHRHAVQYTESEQDTWILAVKVTVYCTLDIMAICKANNNNHSNRYLYADLAKMHNLKFVSCNFYDIILH